jgi:hypothetical protein
MLLTSFIKRHKGQIRIVPKIKASISIHSGKTVLLEILILVANVKNAKSEPLPECPNGTFLTTGFKTVLRGKQ